MPVPLLDLSEQHAAIRGETTAAFARIADSARFILGEPVDRFEANLAKWCGSPHAVGMSSGTDAILAALMALDIGPGDEVIVPSFTFFATAGCVQRVGATPVFVDCDPVTLNIDPAAIAAVITPRTKAIMPVHLFGLCAEMRAIEKIASPRGIHIIEDAAQALGATLEGRQAGAMSIIGCLSFFPTKNLGAFGDAGACLTPDADLHKKLRQIRMHGQTDEYRHQLIGGNFRIDALQAAILDIKLARLTDAIHARKSLAANYNALLRGLPIQTPLEPTGHSHSFNYYTIQADRRDDLCKHLQSKGIGNKVYYPLPLHLQPCFTYLGYAQGRLPHSEAAARRVLSLPLYPDLKPPQQEEVAEAIRSFYST